MHQSDLGFLLTSVGLVDTYCVLLGEGPPGRPNGGRNVYGYVVRDLVRLHRRQQAWLDMLERERPQWSSIESAQRGSS